MKKLFALLLALAMTTQLALPAWAEGTEPSAPAAQTEAPTEAPTEASAEEPAEPAEEETSPAEAAETYRVTFRCTPEDLTLVVYPAAGDIDQAIDPEEDGSYLLEAGEYGYLAAAEGYESVEGQFAVEDADKVVEITLEKTKAEENAPLEDEDEVVDSGTCGTGVTWELTKSGLLTISGSGGINFDFWADNPFYENKDIKNFIFRVV